MKKLTSIYLVHGVNDEKMPIESVQLLRRVLTFNDEDCQQFGEVEGNNMDPVTFNRIQLKLTRSDNNYVDIELLRNDDWIEDYGAHVGGSVFLDMQEMGVEGLAEVLAVDSCPLLEEGKGRVVIGTFKHTSGEVYDLRHSAIIKVPEFTQSEA